MPWSYFKPRVDSNKLLSFAVISSKSLPEDLEENDSVLYWGSTVALESSFIGNALINFKSTFPLSHDPLFLSKHLKYTVQNANELKFALDKLYKMDIETLNKEREASRTYLENYFYRPTSQNLNTLLGL